MRSTLQEATTVATESRQLLLRHTALLAKRAQSRR
jgi:hypothetical protein